MSFGRLLHHFSDQQKVPILVDDVRDWIINHGHQDEVNLYPVDIDPTQLLGMFSQCKERTAVYGEVRLITNIGYYQGANVCWERMICTKEMIHIFDRVQDKSSTQEEIARLLSDLTTPKTSMLEKSAACWADHYAVFRALNVLAPLHLIELLRPAYQLKKKTDNEIANIFKIPEMYVPVMFSPMYEPFYNGHFKTV